jgi:predicted Zn finger-like uncharacterized protein
MKFLCPSCKAKYQIADEKVIGRSVKMKCRQCGHIIEIQESVVGASTSSTLPPVAPKVATAATESPARDEQGRPEPLGAIARLPANIPAKPTPTTSVASASAPKVTGESAAQRTPAHKPLTSVGVRHDISKGKVTPPPAVARPTPPPKADLSAAPRAATSPINRPVPRQTAGGSPFAPRVTKPNPPERSVLLGTAAHAEPVAETGRSPSVHAPSTQPAPMAARRSGEALVEAFTSAVGAPANLAADQFVGDEWYVGINDTPVGPIPLSELRTRATLGQVTIDSLVWRDGFEDWKPVRSFPELLAVVEEAISSVQASRAPIGAPGTQDANLLAMLAATSPGAAGSNLGVQAGAIARPQQDPNAVFLSVATPQLSPEEIAAATGRSLRRSAKGAWVAVAGALALGLAIGFVFFKQAPAAPEVKYVEVARSGPTQANAPPVPATSSQDSPAVAAVEEIKGSPRKVAANEAKPASENVNNSAQLNGLKGLSGLRALGPQSGPSQSGATSGSSGGQTLDSATLQKNVSRYTPSVKRSCWQPALDSRASDAPTTARVSVKIDIAPSGSVSGVSSSGDPRGYRGLASCIESRVRNWSFPPSSGATTVNVPFVFAAQ